MNWASCISIDLGSFFLHLQNFFYTFKLSLNFQKTLWPFKKIHRHRTSKIMSTSGNQNIWLPEVKIYHQKSIFRCKNVSPEVDFRKLKIITGNRLSKVKKYFQKSTSGNQKIFPEVDFRKSKKHSPKIDFRKLENKFYFEYFI